MEGLKLNNKGFTLIELLIAMLIVLIVMLGLLRGILEYNKFTIRAKMKDKATEIAREMTSYIESLPYVSDGSGVQSILYANNSSWNNIICSSASCSFFETETDFYNPGTPTLSNPTEGVSSNLRLYPSSNTINAQCSCRGSNCPASIPVCTYEGFSGRKIYLAMNVARMIDSYGRETGKAASVMVWYFEPFTEKYQQMISLVIKEKR